MNLLLVACGDTSTSSLMSLLEGEVLRLGGGYYGVSAGVFSGETPVARFLCIKEYKSIEREAQSLVLYTSLVSVLRQRKKISATLC